MKQLIIVGKCIHCGDPIYKFQVEAHRGCVREYEFNPDYLDFQKGVEAGRELGRREYHRFMNTRCEHFVADHNYTDSPCKACYEDKLEEWGINHKEVESDVEL